MSNGALNGAAEPRKPQEAYRGATREAVLALRANGLSAPVIAERLGVTRQLVNYHLREARRRAARRPSTTVLEIPAPVPVAAAVEILRAAAAVWGDAVVMPSERVLRVVARKPLELAIPGCRHEEAGGTGGGEQS